MLQPLFLQLYKLDLPSITALVNCIFDPYEYVKGFTPNDLGNESPATGRHIRSSRSLRSGGLGLSEHEQWERRRCGKSVPLQDEHSIRS